jgi:O-antigen/teichoic acid export membrane protein
VTVLPKPSAAPADGEEPVPAPVARRGARGGVVGLAGAAVNGLCGFVLTAVILRAFGAAGAGALFTAIALISILGAVCCLGADTGLVFAMSRRAPRDAARLLTVAVGPAIAVSLVVAAAGVTLAGALSPALFDGGSPVDTDHVLLVRLAFAGVPVFVVSTLLLAAVRATRPVGAYVGVQFVLVPVARPLLIGGAVLLGGGVAAGTAGWLLPLGIAAVVAALLVRPLGSAGGASLRPQRADWRPFWSFALPRAASAAIDASSMWVGVLLTTALAGPAQAGVFAAAGRYALAGLLVMQGLRVAVAPRLSRLLGAGRRAAAADLHRRTTRWIVVASWPVYLLLAVFAPGFLELFGTPLRAGATPLAVLAAAMAVNVAVGLSQTVLLMSGNSRRHLLATAAGLTVTVVAGLLAVPRHGATGAAAAWALGIVVENLLAAAFAHRALGHRLVTAGLVRVAATVAGLTGVAATVGLLVAGRGLAGLGVTLAVLAVGGPAALLDRRVRAAARTALATLRTAPAAPAGSSGPAGDKSATSQETAP